MKREYLKADKICIWKRNDYEGSTDKKLKWCISPMELNTWYIACGWPWYELNTEEEIDINKTCKIDLGGRVIIDGNRFLLVDYDNHKADVVLKINRI